MKRLLICGLAAVMILSFAACGNNSGDKNDDQSGKQTQSGLKQGSQELIPEWVDDLCRPSVNLLMTARMYGGLQLPAAQQKNLNSKKNGGQWCS